MTKSLVLLFTGFTLVACSNQKDNVDTDLVDMLKQQTGQNGRACIHITDIDGYGFNDNVISIDGGRKYYIGTTLMRCHEADMAVQMEFNGPGRDFCGSPNSSIVSQDSKCIMKSLFEFESRKAAFSALDEARNNLKQKDK